MPRLLPEQKPRVETGAVQFGDDWPGVFIRGDNAGWYAFNLRRILPTIEDPMTALLMENLCRQLESSNVHNTEKASG